MSHLIYIKDGNNCVSAILPISSISKIKIMSIDTSYYAGAKDLDACDAVIIFKDYDGEEYQEKYNSKMRLESRIKNILKYGNLISKEPMINKVD